MDFNNRAIQSYHPGSVFKVILAAAAIETGLAFHSDTFTCTGSIEVGNQPFSCFRRQAHGEVDLKSAFALSCNGYFIQLAQRLGRETVLEYARRFGLAQSTGLPLYGESPGRLPAMDDLFYLGHLANTSIGQGLVEATPLQLARIMAIIANDGRDIQPRLILRLTGKNGSILRSYPVKPGARVISAATARQLKLLLEEVVRSGTAQDAQSLLFTGAGKSGTAQTGRAGVSYTWFTGLAPFRGRTLAITVFAEERRHDLKVAGIYSKLAEALFRLH